MHDRKTNKMLYNNIIAILLVMSLCAMQLMVTAGGGLEDGFDDGYEVVSDDAPAERGDDPDDFDPDGGADDDSREDGDGGDEDLDDDREEDDEEGRDADDESGSGGPSGDGEDGADQNGGETGEGETDPGEDDQSQPDDTQNGVAPNPDEQDEQDGQGGQGGQGGHSIHGESDGDPSALAYDPQPESLEEVQAWIDAWLAGADKPKWEQQLVVTLLPPGYVCRLVEDDVEFGAPYYTFFDRSLVLFDPQPESAAEVRAAVIAWEGGADKPRWRGEVAGEWMPTGCRCVRVSDDASFGAAYYTFDAEADAPEDLPPDAPRYDPQPETLEEVLAAIDAWEQGEDKPKWEFEVVAELMPTGYRCELVEDDVDFGADYYTFDLSDEWLDEIVYDPQPETLEEVQTAIDVWEQGGEKPHWEFEVAAELMPAGYRCELVDDDADFGAAYFSFFDAVVYDPQPTTMEEVQAAIDAWEQSGEKPRWEFEVAAELMPAGYFCELVDYDEAFGADYFTVFVRAVSALVQDSDGFYLVGTPGELDEVRQNLDWSYRLTNDIYLDINDYSSATFTAGNGWVGIGKANSPFTGKFDGNNYTVYGLWCVGVTTPTTSNWHSNQGLFGYTEGAHIYNLNVVVADREMTAAYQIGGIVGKAVDGTLIENCTVTGGTIRTIGGGYAGGIVGLSNARGGDDSSPNGTPQVVIRNCRVYSDPTSSVNIAYTSGNYAAGIVGAAYNTHIISCYTEYVNVSASSYSGGIAGVIYGASEMVDCYAVTPTADSRTSYAGGLFGAIYGSSIVSECWVSHPMVSVGSNYSGGFAGTIYGSSNVMDCSVSAPAVHADGYSVGGFSGEISNATVKNSSVTDAELSADTSRVGGFVGYVSTGASIEDCTTLNPQMTANYELGGFVGYTTGSSSNRTYITRCSAINPDIEALRTTSYSYAAGFAGFVNYTTFADCYAAGGTVTAYRYTVGGFAAYAASVVLQNCYAQVDVTTTGMTGATYVGGLIGYLETASSSVKNCYATGSVTSTGTAVGGLIGHMVYNSTVENCYATGTVNGGSSNVGGLVGRAVATASNISNCYFDTTTTRQANAFGTGGSGAAVTPLTTTQMIDGLSITGFNFQDKDAETGDTTNPWYIDEEATYPYLHYQYNGHSFSERNYSLASVTYASGLPMSDHRADFTIQDSVPFEVLSAGAQKAYFPYTGTSNYPVSTSAPASVPSSGFAYDSDPYSLGGISETGIVGFATLPAAVKVSSRDGRYLDGDPTSYTYVRDEVVYTVTVSNHSPDYNWLDVTLTDPLPDGVTLVESAGVTAAYWNRNTAAPPYTESPTYSYDQLNRVLTVQLKDLNAVDALSGYTDVSVEFTALIQNEAVSSQPLDPYADNIRNRGAVSGTLDPLDPLYQPWDYTAGFDDRNTDPIFALVVGYNGNGNTGGSPPAGGSHYRVGDTVTVAGRGTLEKTGYYFHGWSFDPDAEPYNAAYTIYKPGDTFEIGDYVDILLYAVWYGDPPLAEEFAFYKVDGVSFEGLEGVPFSLYYILDPDYIDDHPDDPGSHWILWDTYASDPDGLVELDFDDTGQGYRYYLLVEDSSPAGYVAPTAIWLFYLEDYWEITTLVQGYTHYNVDFGERDLTGDGALEHYLPNYKINYDLPNAGGAGNARITRLGFVLLLGGGVVLAAGGRNGKRPRAVPRAHRQRGGP